MVEKTEFDPAVPALLLVPPGVPPAPTVTVLADVPIEKLVLD